MTKYCTFNGRVNRKGNYDQKSEMGNTFSMNCEKNLKKFPFRSCKI
jgi:hypothetical protein